MKKKKYKKYDFLFKILIVLSLSEKKSQKFDCKNKAKQIVESVKSFEKFS